MHMFVRCIDFSLVSTICLFGTVTTVWYFFHFMHTCLVSLW